MKVNINGPYPEEIYEIVSQELYGCAFDDAPDKMLHPGEESKIFLNACYFAWKGWMGSTYKMAESITAKTNSFVDGVSFTEAMRVV